jgi:hypothetical protein
MKTTSENPMMEDGLKALLRELSLAEIMSLIERTSRWVAPETFTFLPVWFPEHARRWYFYKANWSQPQMNTNRRTKVAVHKVEGNVHASTALTFALGISKDMRPNWSCCHLWGVDDPTFQKANDVVADHRFFSCVGNMVLLPTPLKAFTDAIPEIKAMLRICARNLYGWQCDHDSVGDTNLLLDHWADWSVYPASWPRVPGAQRPRGTVDFTSAIKTQGTKRLSRVRYDLKHAGEFYPREQVRNALAYWRIAEED